MNTEPEVLMSLMLRSGSVMASTVPSIAERLDELAAATNVDIEDIDALADAFVRLAQSLVLIRHPDNPLDTRADVQTYVRRCFGPLLDAATSGSATVAVDHDEQVRIPTRRAGALVMAAVLLAVVLGGAGLGAAVMHPRETPMTPVTPADSVSIAPPSTSAPVSVVPPVADVPPVIDPGSVSTITAQAAIPSTSAPPSQSSPKTTARVAVEERTSGGSDGRAGGPTVFLPAKPPLGAGGPLAPFPSGPGPSGPGPMGPGSGPGPGGGGPAG